MTAVVHLLKTVAEDPTDLESVCKLYDTMTASLEAAKEDVDLTTLATSFYESTFSLCQSSKKIPPAVSITLEAISAQLTVAPYHMVPQFTNHLKNQLKERDSDLSQLRLLIRLTGNLCSCCDAPSGIAVAHLPSMSKFKDIKVKVLVLQNFSSIVGNRRSVSPEHWTYIKKALQAKEWSLREAALKAIVDCCGRCEMDCATSALSTLTKHLEIGFISENEHLAWSRAISSCIVAAASGSSSSGGKKGWGAWLAGKGDNENGSPLEQLDSLFKAFSNNKNVLLILALCTGQIFEAALAKGALDESFEEVFQALTTPTQKDDRSGVAPYLSNGLVDWCQGLGSDSLRVIVVKALLKNVGTKAPKGRCLAALYAAGGILPMLFSMADVAEAVIEATEAVISHPMIPMSVSNAAAVCVGLVIASKDCPAQLSLLSRLQSFRGAEHSATTYLAKVLNALSSLPKPLRDEFTELQSEAIFALVEELAGSSDGVTSTIPQKLWKLELVFSLTSLLLDYVFSSASSSSISFREEVFAWLSSGILVEKLNQLHTMATPVASLQGAPKICQQVICAAASTCKQYLVHCPNVDQARAAQILLSKLLDENPVSQFQATSLLMQALVVTPPRKGEDAAVKVAVQAILNCTIANVGACYEREEPEDVFLGYYYLPSTQRARSLHSAVDLLAETAAQNDIQVIRTIFAKIFDVYGELNESSDSVQKFLLRNVSITINAVLSRCLTVARHDTQHEWRTQGHLELAATLRDQLTSFISRGNTGTAGTMDTMLFRTLGEAMSSLYFLAGAPTVNPQQLILPSSGLGVSGSTCLCASLVRNSVGHTDPTTELALAALTKVVKGLESPVLTQSKKSSSKTFEINSIDGLVVLRAGIETCALLCEYQPSQVELMNTLISLVMENELWFAEDICIGNTFDKLVSKLAAFAPLGPSGKMLTIMAFRTLCHSFDVSESLSHSVDAVVRHLPSRRSFMLNSFLVNVGMRVAAAQSCPKFQSRVAACERLLLSAERTPQPVLTLIQLADTDPLKLVRDLACKLLESAIPESLDQALGSSLMKLLVAYLQARPQRFETDDEDGPKSGKKKYEGESGGEGGRGLARRPMANKDELHSDRGGKLATTKLLKGLYLHAGPPSELHHDMHNALFSCCSLVEVVPAAADSVLDIIGYLLLNSPEGNSTLLASLSTVRAQFHTAFRGALSAILEHQLFVPRLVTVLQAFVRSELADDSSVSKVLGIVHLGLRESDYSLENKCQLRFVSASALVQSISLGWKTTLEIQGSAFLQLPECPLALCQLMGTSVAQISKQWGLAVPGGMNQHVLSSFTEGSLDANTDYLLLVSALVRFQEGAKVLENKTLKQIFTKLLCLEILSEKIQRATSLNSLVTNFVVAELSQDDQRTICQTLLHVPRGRLQFAVQSFRELCTSGLSLDLLLPLLPTIFHRVDDSPPSDEGKPQLVLHFWFMLRSIVVSHGLDSSKQVIADLCLKTLEMIPLEALLREMRDETAAKTLITFMSQLSNLLSATANFEKIPGACEMKSIVSSTWFCCVLGLPPTTHLSGQNFNFRSLTAARQTLEVFGKHCTSKAVQIICRSALGRHIVLTCNLLGALHLSVEGEFSDVSPAVFGFNAELLPLFAQAVSTFAVSIHDEPLVQTKVSTLVTTIGLFATFPHELLSDVVRKCLHTAMITVASSCRLEVKAALQLQDQPRTEVIRKVLSPDYIRMVDSRSASHQGAPLSTTSGSPVSVANPAKKLSINISSFQ